MEAARHSHSSMPLVSRLDHLDFAVSLSFPKHLRSHKYCLSIFFTCTAWCRFNEPFFFGEQTKMKYLEGKQHLPKWRGNCSVGGAGRQSMTMDLAVKEAYLKGSLMDRVACLEHRLFQVKCGITTIQVFLISCLLIWRGPLICLNYNFWFTLSSCVENNITSHLLTDLSWVEFHL